MLMTVTSPRVVITIVGSHFMKTVTIVTKKSVFRV